MNFLSQNISFFLTSSESYDPDRSWRLFFCTTLSVYLNSFNELFLILKLPFVVESVCKVKKFFIFAPNFFEVFFWKISSRRFPKMPFSLSYRSGKIRYLAQRVNLITLSICLPSLSKAGAKLQAFSETANIICTFFTTFFNVFHKSLSYSRFYGLFFMQRRI